MNETDMRKLNMQLISGGLHPQHQFGHGAMRLCIVNKHIGLSLLLL